MKLYTIEEVIDDIQRFEGVTVTPPLHLLKGSRFVRLYSEEYMLSLSDNKVVDDLHLRVKNYLSNKSIHLLCPDVVPGNSDKDTWMYGYNRDATRTVLLAVYNFDDEPEIAFKDVDFDAYDEFMIVRPELGMIIPLYRDTSRKVVVHDPQTPVIATNRSHSVH